MLFYLMIRLSFLIILSLFEIVSFALSNNSFNSLDVHCKLALAYLLTTLLAFLPNSNVDHVAEAFEILGEHATIKVVLELPPKDSVSILVSFESR